MPVLEFLRFCNCQTQEKELKYQLIVNYYLSKREYNYKNIPKKIIIEQFLNFRDNKVPNDYKFWVFNGKVEFMNIHFHEEGITKINIYNKNLELQKFGMEYPNNLNKKLEFPTNFKKMIEYAEIFAKGLPFLRVDFYEVDGKIYFGELTFYPTSGFIHFFPDHEKLDEYYGEKIELDGVKK